ncbi:MAG: 4Fe-4S binding protein [Spirochaetaceae bacterium]|jgi:dihydroorotate dehydrogenase/Pyruvate/2-oxoacid:ferredoxin oxidoreductase delta subunit|nr:4Fe-4S binding protein [Spirochaetaceae bacterium]
MADLSVNVGGLKMRNPIMIGSSPLTAKIELLKEAEENGVTAVSIKHTMMHQKFKAQPRWYFNKDIGIVVSGDPRLDPDAACELVARAKRETDLTLVCNMSGAPGMLHTWGELASNLEQAGADAIELNFNCPNLLSAEIKTAVQGANLGADPEACAIVTAELKKAVKIPVIAKLNTEGGMTMKVAKACEQAGADIMNIHAGYRAAPGIDIYNGGAFLFPGTPRGNFGGHTGVWSRMISNRFIADIARALPGHALIGGSGLERWDQVVECIMFGAQAVQICTAVLYKGFGIIPPILEGIAGFMDEQGYKDIESMRGLSLAYIIEPSQMEYANVAASIDTATCTGCKKCTKMPTCTAINYNGESKKYEVTREDCLGCGLCAGVCPRQAISMKVM